MDITLAFALAFVIPGGCVLRPPTVARSRISARTSLSHHCTYGNTAPPNPRNHRPVTPRLDLRLPYWLDAKSAQDLDDPLHTLGDDHPFGWIFPTRLDPLVDFFDGKMRIVAPRIRNLTRKYADARL